MNSRSQQFSQRYIKIFSPDLLSLSQPDQVTHQPANNFNFVLMEIFLDLCSWPFLHFTPCSSAHIYFICPYCPSTVIKRQALTTSFIIDTLGAQIVLSEAVPNLIPPPSSLPSFPTCLKVIYCRDSSSYYVQFHKSPNIFTFPPEYKNMKIRVLVAPSYTLLLPRILILFLIFLQQIAYHAFTVNSCSLSPLLTNICVQCSFLHLTSF